MGAAVSFAQLPTATVLGTVRDASGAVVPQATLTARNVNTGATRTAVSAADGSYRFAALPVGSYEIQVQQAGFQSAVRSGLQMTVGREAVVDFALQIGAVEQRVEVTAEAPLVNTTSGALGGLVDSSEMSELPLNGRNFAELALLQPGVQRSRVFSTGGDNRMTVYSSSGAPLSSNQTTIDGGRVNTMRSTSTATSVSGGSLGVDGIQEFKLVTNAMSAEYGMSMGSQMVMVSKSGTNAFHGSLFEYHRNDNLDARNFFDYTADNDLDPKRLPPFVRNQYGGSIGGPIVQNKTFFHVVFEGLFDRKSESRVVDVLPDRCRVGNNCTGPADDDDNPTPGFDEFGNPIPIHPSTANLLELWPVANLSGNRFFDNPSTPTDQRYGQTRVDHNFGSNDSMFVRYTIDDTQSSQPRDLPGVARVSRTRNQYLSVSESHIFSPTVINQSRFTYNGATQQQDVGFSIAKFDQPGPGISLVEGKTIGVIEVGGLDEWNPGANDPTEYYQDMFSFGNDVFVTKGAHSLKFGGLYNWFEQFLVVNHDVRGKLEFADVTGFLLGQGDGFARAQDGARFNRKMRFSTIGFYLQDDWRVRPGLTLNLGLRYEFSTQPNEVTGQNGALRNITDPAGTPGPPFLNSTKRNVSPRFGFAWDVTGNSMTAVRGGFGLLYDLGNMGAALRAGSIVPPFGSLITLEGDYFEEELPDLVLPIPIPDGLQGRSLEILDYHMRQPRLYSWNLTLQRQLPLDMAISAGYVGTRGVRLYRLREGNPTVPTVCQSAPCFADPDDTDPRNAIPAGTKYWPDGAPRISPHWDDIVLNGTAAGSWYHGLQTRLTKRVSNGLQFQTSYTWSKVLDDLQGQSASEYSDLNGDLGADPDNPRYEYGPASFDYTHNLNLSTIYHFPNFTSSDGIGGKLANGWWMSNILSLNSGFPFTPVLQRQWGGSRIRGTESNIDRPNIKPGRNNDNIILGTPEQWFDPTAYELQPRGTKGNSSRGHLRGPGFASLDLSIVKDTSVGFLGEAGKIVFRAEFFNLLNRVNFAAAQIRTFTGRRANESPRGNAGQIDETIAPSRQIQLALRLEF